MRRLAQVVIGLALLLSHAAVAAQGEPTPVVPLNLSEGAGEMVMAVEFAADEPVDERSLRQFLPLKEGDTLSPGLLEEAVRFLEWKEVWSEVSPTVAPAEGGVRVTFHLEIKRTVDSVKVSGYETFYAEDLVRRIRIPSGAPLKQEVVNEAADRLREYYRRQGFPDTEVAVIESLRDHRQVALDFHIDEGEPVIVSAVILEGELGFPSDDLAKALKVVGGDRFTAGLDREVKRRAQTFYRDRNDFDATIAVTWELVGEGGKTGVLFVDVETGLEHAIRFVGNKALSRRHLLGLVELSKRPVITDATWRDYRRRIEADYRANGYYKVKVDLAILDEGGRRIIEYRIDEGQRYWIRSIEFIGNDHLDARELESVMRTKPAGWAPFSTAGTLDDLILADDLRKIWFLYRKHGFESAEVVDSRASFEEYNAVDLVIEIDEGAQSIVERVELDGFDDLPRVPKLLTYEGQPFDPANRDADVVTLVAAVSSMGYPEAHVTAEVEGVRTGDVVETTVRFHSEPGPFREVGPVVVQNNLITKDRVIERELPFEEGDPYDPQKLIDAQTNVYRLGLFRRVSVRPLESGKPQAPAVGVEVEERPAGTLSYGFGYETDIGIRVFGEAGYDNLQGMNRRISLRADVSVEPTDTQDSQYVGNLGYRVPRLFDTYLVSRSNAIVVRNTQSLNRYSIEGFTLATALEREISPRFVVGGLVEWDQGDTFDVAEDASLAPEGVKDEGFLRQVMFGPFLELDRRDDPFAPHEGTIDTFRVMYATPALHSDIHYVSMIGKHAQYVPLNDYFTFVYALRGAWALPVDGAFSVPIRDRYFVGGRTTVRGFEENSISPLGADGSPMGGDIMVNGNAEMRFPLLFGIGGAIFFDAGSTFFRQECTKEVCNFSKLDIEDIRRSVGLGLRYITPVGPISVEYGFKLDRRSGESIGAFHFTIGNIF